MHQEPGDVSLDHFRAKSQSESIIFVIWHQAISRRPHRSSICSYSMNTFLGCTYIYIYVCVNYIKYLYIHMGPALLFVSFSSSTRRAKQYILICNMQSKWIVYFVSVILSGYTRNGCAKELGLERPCTSVPTPQKRHTQVKRPRLWELPISTIPRRLLWS